jgi:hypothetical protein
MINIRSLNARRSNVHRMKMLLYADVQRLTFEGLPDPTPPDNPFRDRHGQFVSESTWRKLLRNGDPNQGLKSKVESLLQDGIDLSRLP